MCQTKYLTLFLFILLILYIEAEQIVNPIYLWLTCDHSVSSLTVPLSKITRTGKKVNILWKIYMGQLTLKVIIDNVAK